MSTVASPPRVLASEVADRTLPFNLELYSELKGEAGKRGEKIPDFLHELLCRALGREDLLPLSPGALARSASRDVDVEDDDSESSR